MESLRTFGFSRDAILDTMGAILQVVGEKVYEEPEKYLEKITTESGKEALRIDVFAENTFRQFVKKQMPNLEVFGEESPDPSLNLSTRKSLCVLVDMVDGTDLLERGLHNWCSSAVFFNPALPDNQKIVGAFISVPPKDVYFAIKEEGALMFGNNGIQEISGCSTVKSLSDASICFYGQKSNRLVNPSYNKLLRSIANYKNLRIYTLAGMPMIVKLIDKKVKNAKGIDAVFDFVGQNPHDVVPGAYIAMKAGAKVINLKSGTEMTYADLEKALMEPFNKESKMKYIIAATPELAEEIKSLAN